MPTPDRIYLDNAATSWPKPEAVYQAVEHYLRKLGAPAGRGAYEQAAEVDRRIAAARQGIARLLRARKSEQILFTPGCTDSLNQALHGLLKPGDHVVTTDVEHNSVLRPLRFLENAGRIEVTRVACPPTGVIDPADVAAALRPDTRLLAVNHASNVTGAVQPVAEMAELARQRGVRTLVDAAQTLGHLPWDVSQVPVDLLAASGHKGLLGPLGIGVLYLTEEVAAELIPLRQGGTGSQSDRDIQPDVLPAKFESGSPNVPGILGLAAGVEYLRQRGIDALRQHEQELTHRLLAGLRATEHVQVYAADTQSRVGVISINVAGYDPRELAVLLDSHYHIQVRSGIHCAPRMHRSLGTLERGGTVRFSIGPFNTAEQIDRVIDAVREVASSTAA